MRRQPFERAQLVLGPPYFGASGSDRDRASAPAHRPGPMGLALASFAAPRRRTSFNASSSAMPPSTAPHKNAALRPNSAKKNPAAIGPRTRERLPTDCETPITS